jgi:hypothetical protein
MWEKNGHEIHILTGREAVLVRDKIDKFGIVYHHIFSIVDYNLSIGTNMWKNKKGWWMDQEIWNQSKGIYAHKEKLDVHFDNELRYAQYFPKSCMFILIPERDSLVFPLLSI